MRINGNKTNNDFDYLIIGAGPAGLQLGYFLEKAGRKYLILEADTGPGAFFKKFPRHRTLISINKVYTGYDDAERNLRWDWNSLLCESKELLFKNYSKQYFPPADEIIRYLTDFATPINSKSNIKPKPSRSARTEISRCSTRKETVILASA